MTKINVMLDCDQDDCDDRDKDDKNCDETNLWEPFCLARQTLANVPVPIVLIITTLKIVLFLKSRLTIVLIITTGDGVEEKCQVDISLDPWWTS